MFVFVRGDFFVVLFVHGYKCGFLFVFGGVFMGLASCRNDFGGDLGAGAFMNVVFWGDGVVDMVFGGCDFGGVIFGGDGFANEVFGECGFCGGAM